MHLILKCKFLEMPLFEPAEDDNDSGFETTPRMSQDSRSPSTASTISYSQSIGSISNSSNEKSLEDANQTKKKGIPITISAQVTGNS